jgi:dihydroneopterin aldolase
VAGEFSGRDERDVIELRGLRLTAIVGVLPEERTREQPLELDLDLVVDMESAGRSDALADTVDYGAVCAAVENCVTSAQPQLLESLGVQLASVILQLDERIASVTVGVRKLRPPVPQDLGTSGVRVTRSR